MIIEEAEASARIQLAESEETMKQEKAIRYAEAMQKVLGKPWRKYQAIASRIKQTWVVREAVDIFEDGNETEILLDSEERIINYLLGYIE